MHVFAIFLYFIWLRHLFYFTRASDVHGLKPVVNSSVSDGTVALSPVLTRMTPWPFDVISSRKQEADKQRLRLRMRSPASCPTAIMSSSPPQTEWALWWNKHDQLSARPYPPCPTPRWGGSLPFPFWGASGGLHSHTSGHTSTTWNALFTSPTRKQSSIEDRGPTDRVLN